MFEFGPAQPGDFTKSNGEVIKVPMMKQENRQYKYGEFEKLAHWLSIPYRSEETMIIIVPDDDHNVDDVINELDPRDFVSLMSDVNNESNDVRKDFQTFIVILN
jgi:serine protease inhibitor